MRDEQDGMTQLGFTADHVLGPVRRGGVIRSGGARVRHALPQPHATDFEREKEIQEKK